MEGNSSFHHAHCGSHDTSQSLREERLNLDMWSMLECVRAVGIVFVLIAILRARKIVNWAVFTARALWNLWDLNGPINYPLFGCALYLKWEIVDLTFQMESIVQDLVAKDPNQQGIVKVWLGPVPIVMLIRPRHVKVLLESNTNITKAWPYDLPSEWIGRGLLTRRNHRNLFFPNQTENVMRTRKMTTTSSKWQSRRKIITPTFHFSILKSYKEVFAQEGRVMVDQLDNIADTGREADIFPFLKRCALDIICGEWLLQCQTAMGTHLNSQTGGNTEYCDAVATITSIMTEYFRMPWLWFKPIWYASGKGFRFDRLVKLTRDFSLKVIQERRRWIEEEGIEDEGMAFKKSVFIDMLLLQQAANKLTDEDIREEVDTFMFEGHDTTASAMGFTIWYLGQYPQYQKHVHEEIVSVFGDDTTRDPTEADLRQLQFLERCIKEALRLMPSVPILGRTLSEDLEIEGVTLPAGLSVAVAPVLTHRDPDHWERPFEYFPDHFLPEKESARHPYAFVPFSAGPRNCIGQKFAIAEEKTVLSWFFRRYSVETVEPYPGNRPIPEIVLKPSVGFSVRLFKRH
ncbi:hypothetical protein PRIPAC_80662 [Pristionchus pacificus]|uniref:Cytochrome P450 n=1 Tax=Pristionchus pacificus TaxID=54126 RepID=A0A2A6CP37_PRIPA|nr:hypothetical protein PRIPAC_80662 [Pristionchus pacificus]|eukprot:PDM79899.1 cytochrome P450 [Pristionchus pacificus]